MPDIPFCDGPVKLTRMTLPDIREGTAIDSLRSAIEGCGAPVGLLM
jgi:hypothetical protein